MCVDRQELKQGTHLVLDKEYEIKEVIGLGASCVVYLAENCTNRRKVLIKELYPIELGIFRDNNNALVIPVSSRENFSEYKEKLKRAVDLQISFHNAEDSGNFTSDVEEITEYNNTLYVIMGRVIGDSYNNHTPENLTSVLKIGCSLAKAVAMYHNKGYLHLDIKAENIFKIKETDELVKLFDFDSVHTKEEIQNGDLSFSVLSSAPEVRNYFNGGTKLIDERSDIFSIGALLFKKIMGRGFTQGDLRPYKKWNFDKVDLLKTVSPQTKRALTTLFRKTLAQDAADRYPDTDALIAALDNAIELSEAKIFLANHNITTTTSKDYYISRPEKVKEIREKLENYHIAYLNGIGGIGKSETAREYAETYRNQYDVIHLTHYSVDLKHTIALLNFINLDDRELKFEEKYQLRLNLLSKREMYNANTLLIIDNYNVSPDSDEYEKNVEILKTLKKLDIHILFTTRTIPNDGNRRIDIEELSDNDLRELFFAVNPKDRDSVARIAQVNELIEAAYKHTLTVDLVAHQTVQIERFGKKTLADYIAVLKNSGLNNEVKLSVYNNKDDNEKNAIIFDHIKALFDFSELSDKERYVMVNACLLPVSGMETAQFCEFIDLEHYDNSESSDWGEDSTITNLVTGGWMKRAGEYGRMIALHPIISQLFSSEVLLKRGIVSDCYSVIQNLNNIHLLPEKMMFSPKNFASFLETTWFFVVGRLIEYSKETELKFIYKAIRELYILNRMIHFIIPTDDNLQKYNNIIKLAINKTKHDIVLRSRFIELYTLNAFLGFDTILEKQEEAIHLLEKDTRENHLWSSFLSLYVLHQKTDLGNNAIIKCLNSIDKSMTINQLINTTVHPLLLTDCFNQSFLLSQLLQSHQTIAKKMAITILCYERVRTFENFFACFNYFWIHSDFNWNLHQIAIYYDDLAQCYGYTQKFELQLKSYLKSAYFNKIVSKNYPFGYGNKNSISLSETEISENDLDSKQLFRIAKAYIYAKDFKNALLYSLKNEKLLKASFSDNHPDLQILYQNISYIYSQMGNKTEAFLYQGKLIPKSE